MDQSKKTMRHFYCRDVLWESFEQMANDFDCSIDYLINEAMRYYARSKNYQAAAGAQPSGTGPESIPGRPPTLPESNRGAAAAGAPAARRSQPPPPPPSMGGGDGAMPAAARRPATVPPPSGPPMARRAPAPAPQ